MQANSCTPSSNKIQRQQGSKRGKGTCVGEGRDVVRRPVAISLFTWTEPWRSAGVRLPPNMLLVCLGVSGQAAVPFVPPCNVGTHAQVEIQTHRSIIIINYYNLLPSQTSKMIPNRPKLVTERVGPVPSLRLLEGTHDRNEYKTSPSFTSICPICYKSPNFSVSHTSFNSRFQSHYPPH